jgi:hypothetical protein
MIKEISNEINGFFYINNIYLKFVCIMVILVRFQSKFLIKLKYKYTNSHEIRTIQ